MDAFSQPLGDVVRNRRTEVGLTQVQLAELIHAEKRTILNIENYKGNPKMEILYPLVRELKINPIHIFYPEANYPSSEITQFQFFLSQCSQGEITFLYTVCQGVLEALRSNSALLKE